MRLCDWCADCNNHPNGTFCPEPYHTAAQQTLGVSHDAPIIIKYKSYKSYKSYASVTPTQHAHRRCHQKSPAYPCGKSASGYAPRIPPLPSRCPAYPNGTSSPEPYHTAAQQTLGVYNGAPILSDKSDKSDGSDTSATPPQTAHRRCHKKSIPHR